MQKGLQALAQDLETHNEDAGMDVSHLSSALLLCFAGCLCCLVWSCFVCLSVWIGGLWAAPVASCCSRVLTCFLSSPLLVSLTVGIAQGEMALMQEVSSFLSSMTTEVMQLKDQVQQLTQDKQLYVFHTFTRYDCLYATQEDEFGFSPVHCFILHFYSLTPSLTHTHTPSLTHTHTLTHSLTLSLSHSLTHSHTHTRESQTKINMHTPPSLRSLFPTWRCKERGLCLQCHKCRNHQSPLAQVRKSCMGCGGRVHQIAPARAGTASPHTRRGDSCRRRCCPSTPLR